MVYMLWLANIIGTPIFAIIAVYYGMSIHNIDFQENSICDQAFASFTEIGLGLVMYGIVTILLYCTVGICICSKIEWMPFTQRLVISSTVYILLMIGWLVFYGFMFYAYYMASNQHGNCYVYAPNLKEIFEITIPAFTVHTVTMPFFFIICVINVVKSVRDESEETE